MTATQPARSCVYATCGNTTTDPSGLCHHHRDVASAPTSQGFMRSDDPRKSIPAPTPSAPVASQFDAELEKAREMVTAKISSRSVHLVYADRNDRITDDQFEKFMEGGEESYDAISELDDAFSDGRWSGAMDEAKSLVKESWADFPPVIRDSYEDADEFIVDSDDFMDEVRDSVGEHDSSNPWKDCVRNTPDKLIRASLDYEVPDMDHITEENLDEITRGMAAAAGIDHDTNESALQEIIANASYGGSLEVIWAADVSGITDHGDANQPPDRATLKDPYLLVFNGMNGSGHDARISGTVTVESNDSNRRIKADGKHGWDSVAGVVVSAYKPAETSYRFPKVEGA